MTLEASPREFQEETGFLSHGPFLDLGAFVQASGRLFTAYACEGDCNAEKLIRNASEIQWPPRSGRKLQIPDREVARPGDFAIPRAGLPWDPPCWPARRG